MEKLKLAVFILIGMVLGYAGASALVLSGKIGWLLGGSRASIQGSFVSTCVQEKSADGKTFFVSCGGFLN